MSAAYEVQLRPGETLGDPFPIEPGDAMSTNGYEVHPVIKPEGDEEGNSVLITIKPRGSTEPLLITGQISLSVVALRGAGVAVVYNLFEERLRLFGLAPNEPAADLGPGDAYYYHNIGRQPLVLRDDCKPPFQPTDEESLFEDMTSPAIPDLFWQSFRDLARPVLNTAE